MFMKKCFIFSSALLAVFCSSFMSCSQNEDTSKESVLEPQNGIYTYNLYMDCGIPDFDEYSTRAATSNWSSGSVVYLRFLKSGTSSTYISGKATYNGSSWTFTTNDALTSTSTNISCTALYVADPTSTSGTEIVTNQFSAVYKGTGSYICSSHNIYVNITLSPMTWRMRFKGSVGTKIKLPAANNDIKYISSISLSSLEYTTNTGDVSLTVGNDGYTSYIYGLLNNTSGYNTIYVINEAESKDYQFATFAESKLPIGSSGYITIPTVNNYYSLGWSQVVKQLKLNVAVNQLTVISCGAAADFTYEADVNVIYCDFITTSKLSGMSDAELKSYVMSNGIDIDVENVCYNSSFSPNTNITLVAFGVAKDGTSGAIYKKSFSTGTNLNQPEVTISDVKATTENADLKWSWNIVKNYYCVSYYQIYSNEEYGLTYAAWLISNYISNGIISLYSDDTTWICDRESSESIFYVYSRGVSSNGTLSNNINSAHSPITGQVISRTTQRSNSNTLSCPKDLVNKVKVRIINY